MFRLLAFLVPSVALAWSSFQVKPREFDPGKTYLVQAEWLEGIGCPTTARTYDGAGFGSYTDPALSDR